MPSVVPACVLILGLCLVTIPAAAERMKSAAERNRVRRPAVAAPNARVGLAYGYSHQNQLVFDQNGPGASLIQVLGDQDSHSVSLGATGTIPLGRIAGLRGQVRGAYLREETDDVRIGNQTVSSSESDDGVVGGSADFFLRDPDMGSIEAALNYDHFEFDGNGDADRIGGAGTIRLFAPDLGGGPVDWFATFEYAYVDSSPDSGGSIETDVYRFEGGVSWYLTPNFSFGLGGEWQRSDSDTGAATGGGGNLLLRWLALPGRVPVEVSLGGSMGVTNVDPNGFDSDDAFGYGVSLGVQVRFNSGETLVDLVRAYD